MAESADEAKKRRAAQQAAQAVAKAQQQAEKEARRTKPGAPTVTTQDWTSPAARTAAAPGSVPVNPLLTAPIPGQPQPQEQPILGSPPVASPPQFTPPTAEEAAQGRGEFQVRFASPANPLTSQQVFANAMRAPQLGAQNLNTIQDRTRELADAYRRGGEPERPADRFARIRQNEEDIRKAPPEQREKLRQQQADASPEQRDKLREEYRDTVRAKVASAREFASGSPMNEAQKMDKYREHLKRQGIPVDSIGMATMVRNPDGTPGLDIPSPAQEYAARNEVNQASRAMQKLEDQERILSSKKDAESLALANQRRMERLQLGHDIGFFDPLNPRAGLNTDNAVRKTAQKMMANDRLARQNSTLSAVAQQQQAEVVGPPLPQVAVPSAVQNQADVEASAQELMGLARERRTREDWLDDFRRRQAQIMGRYAYAY
jgi:hypothetical protein